MVVLEVLGFGVASLQSMALHRALHPLDRFVKKKHTYD